MGELSELSNGTKTGVKDQSEISLLALVENTRLSSAESLAAVMHTEPSGIKAGLSNIASVYMQTFAAAPGEFANSLSSDFKKPETALKVLESTAIGFGTAVLLAKSPVFAKSLLTLGGLGAGTAALGSSLNFSAKAYYANNASEQSALVQTGSKTLGKLSADLLETSPALLAGAYGGLRLTNKFSSLSSISESVKNVAELPARRLAPEGLHYLSTDAQTLKIGSTGEGANLFQAAQEMVSKTPWRGLEEGRFFKLKSATPEIKLSARLPGNESEVYMGKRAEQLFHTHENHLLPTSGDFNTVYKTGVIGVPKEGIITFYEGTGRQAEAILKLQKSGKLAEFSQAAEALEQQTFKSVVFDPQKQLSVRVDLRWNSQQNGMMPVSIKPLDYAESVKKLSKWKGELNIDALPAASEALLKPGMTDLIRRISGSI